MKLIKKLLLSCLLAAPCFASEEPNDTILQQFGNFILESLQRFDEKSLKPETLHILCNIFYTAFEYSRLDLEYSAFLRTLLSDLQKLKNSTQPTQVNMNSLQMLLSYEKNRSNFIKQWNHISEYMNNNEEINTLFTRLAKERLDFLNSIIAQYGEEYLNLFVKMHSAVNSKIQKLYTLSNCLQAACEKQLPFDYQEKYSSLREVDMVSTLIERINRETAELQENLIEFEEFHNRALALFAVLDMLYFNKLHEILLTKTNDEQYSTILFNENGLIPEEERKDLLPYVIN